MTVCILVGLCNLYTILCMCGLYQMEVYMIDPKLLKEIQFPTTLPEVQVTELDEVWSHWEIRQTLQSGDIDRAAELAEMAQTQKWS